jgi:hypothetical protein
MPTRRPALKNRSDWPRFLFLSEVAAYVGVSPAVFLAEVKAKWWPEPTRPAGKTGPAVWDKVLTDSWLAKGLSRRAMSTSANELADLITFPLDSVPAPLTQSRRGI